MSDDEARATFKVLRWADNGGEPYCPRCGCVDVWTYKSRPSWKCQGCRHKFSVTSGTIFADRKLPVRDYLAAIAIFVNGAKGISALQLGRDLDVQYRTAYVLAMKLREAMEAEQQSGADLSGVVEVDGAFFGGHVRPTRNRDEQPDRRLVENKSAKRQVVVVARERNGRTIPFVVQRESQGVPLARARIKSGAVVHADEASAWDALHASFQTFRVNHSKTYRGPDGACTNWAESYFARLRRAELGQHHHISGRYLAAYANEAAWREDHRRVSNGEQYGALTAAALALPVSRRWKGYWQRSAAK